MKGKGYIIYTDGGCAFNPGGPGGYAAVIIDTETGEISEISGGFARTTNNRMEVMAVIAALEYIGNGNVELYSDSQYVVKTMEGQFRKKKNHDLWGRLDRLCDGREIALHWVRGHNGNHYNERCDKLCSREMEKTGLPIDKGYEESIRFESSERPMEKSSKKKGAMGVDIRIPECFENDEIEHLSAKKYAEQYQVNLECAKRILVFEKSGKSFRSYMELKTEGMDYWSRKSSEYMLELFEDQDQLWETIHSYFGDEKDAMVCLRWCCRGLPLLHAIRKVLVDEEVRRNCF